MRLICGQDVSLSILPLLLLTGACHLTVKGLGGRAR
nr:MAG TPA: hypothetical protein [Caudoviricetes sp.]